ncbi:Sporulation kinase A [compost metagenome]
MAPTTLSGRPAFQIIVRDISERKKNEELLINSEKLYVAGQLAAGIAHEIRNPLTSLKGFLQLISLEAQASLHNTAIVIESVEEPLWVFGVENQIKQVFINVLKNAIEAMVDGGTITVASLLEGEYVVTRITDEGPGIPKEQMAKMGQPFYTTKDKGTGLGLMVTYKIIDNHQGRIHASSEIGLGTTFTISFPYAAPSKSDRSEEKKAAGRAQAATGVVLRSVAWDTDGMNARMRNS